jgi:HPr kinase/phosphorylase
VSTNVHATGIVLGGIGLMLRGPSGSGKSLLALALLDEWQLRGRESALVADDRLDLSVENGALSMAAPPQIAGLIELRGRGIVQLPFIQQAEVRLVVDIVPTLERMVEEVALQTSVMGVTLARCPVPSIAVIDRLHQLILVREAIRALVPGALTPRQKTT